MDTEILNPQIEANVFASDSGAVPEPLIIRTLELPSLSFPGKYKTPVYIPEWERIVLGHFGSNRLSLWNSRTFELIDFRYTREKLHFCLAYSTKTGMIYSSGLDGQVTGIKVNKDSLGYYGDDVMSAKLSEKIEKISCLDDCNLLACTSGDSLIYLLDIYTLEVKQTLSLGGVEISWEFAYDPKDDTLAILAGDFRESFIFLYSLKTFRCLCKLSAGRDDIGNKALAFCGQRNTLIAQPKTNLIKFWSFHSSQKIKAHKTIILPESSHSFCLIEELDLLLVCLKSNKLQFYKLSTGQLTKSLDVFFEIETIFKLQNEEKIFAINKDFSQVIILKSSQL